MTEPAPRVVATDLDGTIVRSDGSISERTRGALAAAEAHGALVVLVTGRPPRWLRGVAEATGHRGLAICANGALVVDLHTGEVVQSRPIAADRVAELVRLLRAELPELRFAVESVDDGFVHEPEYHPKWSAGAPPAVAELERLVASPAAKLLSRHDTMTADELLARAQAVIGSDLATLTHSSADGLLEISAAGVTKATTLAEFCVVRGFTPRDVVAFGDMPNDLPMLAWAGRSVAVANAHPDVLAAVDQVTASNDEDGVARVLEEWFGVPA